MRALTASDLLFLLLESKKQPMHVAGLCLFELPSSDDNFVRNLVEKIKSEQAKPNFPFNQVLKYGAFWQTDDDFDINHHFKHVILKHGSDAELMAYVSDKHGMMLDRTRPLWEFHLIEGIAPQDDNTPPRFAVFLKIHHAMADGVAAMRLFERSLSTSAEAEFTLPFWLLSNKYRKQSDAIAPKRKSTLKIISEQLSTLAPVAKALLGDIKQRRQDNFLSTFDTPKSILNQRILGERLLIMRSFEKQRFVHLAKHFAVTTNDVVLAVCSGALRAYLLTQNALPTKAMTAFVPISLRKDDSSFGNQMSFVLTNLATHEANPITRLRIITDSVDNGKTRFGDMTHAQAVNYSLLRYGWAGINLATNLYPTRQAFNLIISNVPSNNTPLYLNGARLTGIFPASVLFGGQALNITLANHQNRLDFGITACGHALPNIEALPDFIEKCLAEYESYLIKQE